MTVSITWKDGTVDTAETADDILALLASKQMDRDVDIRTALAKRALYWGDVNIDPTDDALAILEGLVAAGMLKSVEA